jgi:hypothetical protein
MEAFQRIAWIIAVERTMGGQTHSEAVFTIVERDDESMTALEPGPGLAPHIGRAMEVGRNCADRALDESLERFFLTRSEVRRVVIEEQAQGKARHDELRLRKVNA